MLEENMVMKLILLGQLEIQLCKKIRGKHITDNVDKNMKKGLVFI